MDSSPRPTRRFSRWQTKKRTFVLGGVTYNPATATAVKETITLSNSKEPKIILERISETVKEKTIPTGYGAEVRREKREMSEGGNSSDSSTTNKENKVTTDGPSPAKRARPGGSNQEVSVEDSDQSVADDLSISVSKNVSSKSLTKRNAEQINQTGSFDDSKEKNCAAASGQDHKILSEKRGNLRNRSLLTPAETLLKNRQYPVAFYPAKKVPSPQEKASGDKEKAPYTKKAPSPPQNSQYSAPSPLKSKKVTQKSKKKKEKTSTSTHKTPQQFNDSKVQRPRETDGKENSPNVSQSQKASRQNLKGGFKSTPSLEKANSSLSFESNASNNKRYGLRDRSILPTPERVQQKRQYPISFFYSAKKSDTSNTSISLPSENTSSKGKQNESERSVAPFATEGNSFKSSSVSRHDVSTIKKSQKKGKQDSPPVSLSECSSGTGTVNQSVVKQSFKKNNGKIPSKRRDGGLNKSAVVAEGHVPSGTARSSTSVKIKQSKAQQSLRPNQLKISESVQTKPRKSESARNNEVFTCDNIAVNDSCSDLPEVAALSHNSQNKKVASKHTKKSLSVVKPFDGKGKAKHYSLPRRQIAEPFHSDEVGQKSLDNISQHPSQSSIQILDKSWKRTSKVAERKSAAQPEPRLQRPSSSINETVVGSQKIPRKRKLVEELDRAEEITRQSKEGKKGTREKTDIYLQCENGQSRKASDVTLYDVILQALTETENRLSESVDNHLCERLVKKVMSKIKRNIKPMIPKVQEVKDLQHVIRKQKLRCKQLMGDVAKKQIEKTQLINEKQSLCGQDINMMRINQWMKNYTQLMAAVNNTTD